VEVLKKNAPLLLLGSGSQTPQCVGISCCTFGKCRFQSLPSPIPTACSSSGFASQASYLHPVWMQVTDFEKPCSDDLSKLRIPPVDLRDEKSVYEQELAV
jgi:hypothetical protein